MFTLEGAQIRTTQRQFEESDSHPISGFHRGGNSASEKVSDLHRPPAAEYRY